jgi:geranylgeranyl diphosphate synthase type II
VTLTLAEIARTDDAQAVLDRIGAFFDERERAARACFPRYVRLWQAARASADGGKKFRPALVVASYRELGGTTPADAIDVAAAFELLHTAFLIHDDIIDGDETRRGRPNLVGSAAIDAAAAGLDETGRGAWSEASAILAGDLLIHAAQSMVARLRIDEDVRSSLLDLVEKAVFITAAGELADVGFATGIMSPTPADVLAMTECKTAHYSFAGPLQAGALLAGSDRRTVVALGEIGRLTGIAFQLRDDVLGVFGDEALTGKSTLGDLGRATMTPLMSYARTTSAWPRIHRHLGAPALSGSAVVTIRRLLVDCGALEFVERMIADHARRADDAIREAELPVGLANRLGEMVRQASERVT